MVGRRSDLPTQLESSIGSNQSPSSREPRLEKRDLCVDLSKERVKGDEGPNKVYLFEYLYLPLFETGNTDDFKWTGLCPHP